MKIIIVCQGSYGDVLPFLTVGKILQQQRFDVEFVSYSIFKPLADDAGLKFFGVCTQAQYEEMVSCDENLSNEDFCYHHFSSCSQYAIHPVYEFIADRHRKEKCIVISSLICDGALWACKDYAIPFIAMLLSPSDILRRLAMIQKLERGEKIIDTDISRERLIVDSVRERMGLPAFSGDREQLLPDIKLTICLFPYSMVEGALPDVDLVKHGVHFTGFLKDMQKVQKNTADIDPEVDIVYTCGSAFCASTQELDCFELLCESLGKNGLVISNNFDFDGKVFSPRVKLARSVNMRRVLHNAQLIIHHGGIGTIADAIYARCPQLIMPRAFDQFSNADMVSNIGIGARYDLNAIGDKANFEAVVKEQINNRQMIQEIILKSGLDCIDMSMLADLLGKIIRVPDNSRTEKLEYI